MSARYHVTILTVRGAEKYTRLVHKVADGVGLGWRPYRYYVLRDGCLSTFACHRGAELKRWLKAQGLKLGKLQRSPGGSWAVASGWTEEAR
jgi:hypothetical protein